MGKEDRRFHFTKARIDSIEAPGRRTAYHDLAVPELGLFVQPTGTRAFFWFRRVEGKPVYKGIGNYPALSLEQARDKAREHSASLAQWKLRGFQGESPFERKRGLPTFGELVEDYIQKQVKPHGKRPEKAEKAVRWMVDKYLPMWKDRKLGAVRRADVLGVHQSLGENRKTLANRVVQLLKRMFNFALNSELWKGENPAARIKLYHEESRTRFAQPSELPVLFAELKKDPSPDLRDYVLLSLWTGARKSDVLSMRWEDVSLGDNRWEVPDPKSRVPYLVPLTPEAVKILKDRQQTLVSATWVFPGVGKSGHLVDLKRPWKELLKRTGIVGLRQHDLRRTLGSWQAGLGTSLPIIGKSLGHTSVQATQVYGRLMLDPVREAVNNATQAMILASKKKPGRRR